VREINIFKSKARRMKGRGNCPPSVGVRGELAEGYERGLCPSRVTRDVGAGKGLEPGWRYLESSKSKNTVREGIR
jgi:hypothetical protein